MKNGKKDAQCRPANTHGTRQWAAKNVNIQTGCEHGCKYCYAHAYARRFGRVAAGGWRAPALRTHDIERKRGVCRGQVMFPSSHDITPANLEECAGVLLRLLRAGNRVLIVSKPTLACIERLCRDLQAFKSQVLFRFTLGSVHDETLRFWEPGAPSFEERIACLKHAYENGYATSLSCEPLLDANNVDALVEAVRPYTTHSIWLGPAERLAATVALTCPGDAETAKAAANLARVWDVPALRALYASYKDDPMVRWKNTIKKLVGVPLADAKGLDV